MINSLAAIDINVTPWHSSSSKPHSSFLARLNEASSISSFACENDSALAVSDHSFLIYGGQTLTLFNIDGPLRQIAWSTQRYDSIKQIRWSSYHRAYLIMTARIFYLLTLPSYEIIPLQLFRERLHLFTCDRTDLWLVSVSQEQELVHYDLPDWLQKGRPSLDQLGLHRSDTICAIEVDVHGETLVLLVAERNQNLSVGVQRRRRLILVTLPSMSASRIVYFSGADDLYWTLTSITSSTSSTNGWLLGKWFDRQLTFVDDQCPSRVTCMNYRTELRNLAMTTNGHYLALRTVTSLDIFSMNEII